MLGYLPLKKNLLCIQLKVELHPQDKNIYNNGKQSHVVSPKVVKCDKLEMVDW